MSCVKYQYKCASYEKILHVCLASSSVTMICIVKLVLSCFLNALYVLYSKKKAKQGMFIFYIKKTVAVTVITISSLETDL